MKAAVREARAEAGGERGEGGVGGDGGEGEGEGAVAMSISRRVGAAVCAASGASSTPARPGCMTARVVALEFALCRFAGWWDWNGRVVGATALRPRFFWRCW